MPTNETTKPKLIGYANISPAEPAASVADQIAALTGAGCEPDAIFFDVLPMTVTAFPKLQEATLALSPGDTIVVTRPVRLSRSISSLVGFCRLMEHRRFHVRILEMSLDTGTPEGQRDLNVMSHLSAFEDQLQLRRQLEGVARGKAQGHYKGRIPVVSRMKSQVKALQDEGLTINEIVEKLAISRSSVFRILRELAEDADLRA